MHQPPTPSSSESGRSTELVYPSVSWSVATAHREVADWLAEHGAATTTQQNAALIVSELATNAVQATPSLPFSVTVDWKDGAADIDIVVTNHDAAPLPPQNEWGRPPFTRRGRGLTIVSAIARSIHVVRVGRTNAVRAALDAMPSTIPPVRPTA